MISLIIRSGLLLPVILLAGCDTVVMNPSGDIAAQQGHLIVISTLLMLLIIVPVIALTILFAWRYRKSNTSAKYDPDWDHSTKLELVIWGAPLLIIIALGLLTWISTHQLDPYRPLQRLDAKREIPAGTEPLVVQVVALDWKWLFIYPEQGIATVNELVTPVDVPVRFKITASNAMNSFYIPALAGQIYAMPGMDTTLNAVMNKPGVYEGFSANYSGAGFSHMRFKYHGVSAADFEGWVQKTKAGGGALERDDYLQLEKPSEREPVRHFGKVTPHLYDAIVNRCVAPGTVCMSDMMAADSERIKADAARKATEEEKPVRPVAQSSAEASPSHSHIHQE
ncbi:ubiquinol oxidase subunit II [Noviherbaspirillum massiliense]|uniref:ubiquinol oxidase subunit II n=1 Tax=Noviherbaspirillum massiliense TaxID=1465823 RepID=UPI0005525646|nr:ubiquinol oxidase subunit II [Noviherbaspirillum massiliense]